MQSPKRLLELETTFKRFADQLSKVEAWKVFVNFTLFMSKVLLKNDQGLISLFVLFMMREFKVIEKYVVHLKKQVFYRYILYTVSLEMSQGDYL